MQGVWVEQDRSGQVRENAYAGYISATNEVVVGGGFDRVAFNDLANSQIFSLDTLTRRDVGDRL